jgi:Domain of unknown function (DUF5666)
MYTKLESTYQMQLTFGNRVRAAIIGGGASLILATAALAAPALAADQPTTTTPASQAIGAHTHQLHGTVKTAAAAGASSFLLTTERYGDVTVSFTAPTPKGHGHALGKARAHELASLADLKAGERVIVQGRTSADGKTFVARRVHVLPAIDAATHETMHLVGTIASATATTLTFKLADGTSQSVTVSADTRIRPQGKTIADLTVGTRVTVVSKNGTATGIVVMPV